MSLVNRIKQASIDIAGALTPVLKNSTFKETGKITPDEFVSIFFVFISIKRINSSLKNIKVAAGDHLVWSCPTWNWSTGDEGKIKNFLPKEKQFLVTR